MCKNRVVCVGYSITQKLLDGLSQFSISYIAMTQYRTFNQTRHMTEQGAKS